MVYEQIGQPDRHWVMFYCPQAAGYGVGVLQAAEQGVGIYAQIRFRVFGGITEYR